MTDRANVPLADLDRASLFHPVTSIADLMASGPVIYTGAKGVEVTREGGQRILDMGAGLWCVNVGYGREELVKAGEQALRDLSFQHFFGGASCEATIRLADRVKSLFNETVPGASIARVFFGTSGSDANDTAYKFVRYYNNLRGKPAKKKVISRKGAYHGLTHAAASLTGISGYHTAFDLPIEGIFHVECPHFYAFGRKGESEAQFTARLLAELEALIAREGADTIAAFIAEPVMGTGGVFTPPAGYFEGVQAILDRHDILLIADEVITGFGRTGQWFGSGTYGLRPDFVSLAKGLTSAYFPMSASLVSQRVWDVLESASPQMGAVMHGFTYSGHPVGSAIGLANLDVMQREDLPARAAALGPRLLESLCAKVGGHEFIGDVRGVGLMASVEFVADKATRRRFPEAAAPHKLVAKHALAEGVLSRALPFLPVNSFSPPLTITEAEIDEATSRYARALDKATPALRSLLG